MKTQKQFPPPRFLLITMLSLLTAWTVGLFTQGPAWAAHLWQTIPPPPATPCLSQSSGPYLFEFLGYRTTAANTTLTWRVKTAGPKDIGYLAFGTGSWTRLTPTPNSTVRGALGAYQVSWTTTTGNPGFASLKFAPQFSGYSQGKQDTFSFTVTNFAVNNPMLLEVKAGNEPVCVSLTLTNPACNQALPTATPTPTTPRTPTPSSPLPTPTPKPTIWASQFPTVEVYLLDATTLARPLTEAQKGERWRQGLPVPLVTLADETKIPRKIWPQTDVAAADAAAAQAASAPAAAAVPSTPLTLVDGWATKETENLETATTFAPGGCRWAIQSANSSPYAWGRAETRSTSKSHALWPAGTPAGQTNLLPPNSPYPGNLETWLQCELDQPNGATLLAQFQLWLELQDADDTFAVRLYKAACTAASPSTFLGGLEWKGSGSHGWIDYHLYYPNFQSTSNKACAEFKFKSGPDGNMPPINHGPWLDDIGFSSYQQPPSSVNCQDKEYTFHLDNAPGSGNVSKGVVLPPYADDFSAGVVDDPANDRDIAGMISRLKAAGVQSVRLEFMVHPSAFMNVTAQLSDPLNTVSPYQIDLRHYDRVIDMLCANQIAVLGLLDYQTLQRHDWQSNFSGYKDDFVAVTKQLATYFKDRIRSWEIWNEPNYAPTRILASDYATLLTATYDTLKAIDSNDKVLFAGLAQTGQKSSGNSFGYFADVSSALGKRSNPAPYDIFALHPYPSDEYKDDNGKVVVDPSLYLRWEQPTTINKFFDSMTKNGKANQPLWITEIGWNRAVDSNDPATLACAAINTTMVNGVEQALYALQSFTILYQETGWDAKTPSVTKIFWYQYMDTGVPQTICNQATSTMVSPSWGGSYLAQSAAAGQAQVNVNWWFGLYQGINWDKKGVIDTNPVQCIFRKYPFNPPDQVYDCLPNVYLPLIQNSGVPVSGQ